MKEGRRLYVCQKIVASRTDPTHSIPAKSLHAIANLLKKKVLPKFLSVRLL